MNEDNRAKALITGANGGLGQVLGKELSGAYRVLGLDAQALDVQHPELVRRTLEREQPAIVLHCAAFTRVDQAETSRAQCYAVNATGTENLARACGALGIPLLYLSTDYVFNGRGEEPYRTDTPTDPVNYYGYTKLMGERLIQQNTDRYFIVRSSWLFGPVGENFIRKIVRKRHLPQIDVVSDQIGSPTYTVDLARGIDALVRTGRYGVYHLTNEGFCSWADFAEAVFARLNIPTRVRRVTSDAYAAPAARPHNSRLSKDKLDEIGLARLPDWRDALDRCLAADDYLKDTL